MKCPSCGMKYEGAECPNCALSKAFETRKTNLNSGRFETEAEFDEYLERKEDEKLKSHVNRWLVFSIVLSILGFAFWFISIISSEALFFDNIADSCFGAAIGGLFFWYLSDIRRLLIMLNKKK